MAPSLEYDLGSPDQDAFLVHHAKHAPYIVTRNRKMRILWSCAMLVVALGLWVESPVFGLGFLGVAAAFIVLYGPLNAWWYVRYNRQLNASQDAQVVGRTRLELENGQLSIEAVEGSSTMKTSAIRRIDESDSHFFIYFGPSIAQIVPKSVVQSEQFVQCLRAQMKEKRA